MGGGDLQAPPFTIRNTNPLARCAVQILGKGEIHMNINEMQAIRDRKQKKLDAVLVQVFGWWCIIGFSVLIGLAVFDWLTCNP